MSDLTDAAFAALGGSTDSEYLFGLFLDRHRALGNTLTPALRLARALEQTLDHVLQRIHELGVRAPSYLNIVVADGRHAAACRITTDRPQYAESLHVHAGHVYRVVDGECRMLPPTDSHGAIIIASEQLSDDSGWTMVPPNHLVVVQTDRRIELKPYAMPVPADGTDLTPL